MKITKSKMKRVQLVKAKGIAATSTFGVTDPGSATSFNCFALLV